jgi:beta-mannosidase
MKRDYKIPTDFVKYNYISQLLQARGMQIAIEAHRRAKPYNMGSLYWQLNDCWPVVSWSSMDYLGNWKALHYQIKRSFENQVILTEEKDGVLNFYAINDELKSFEGVQLEMEVNKFDGENVLTAVSIQNQKLDQILKFDPATIAELVGDLDKNGLFLNLIVRGKDEKIIAESNYFFSKPKELKLSKPTIKIKKISPTEIEISTDVLAKDVYLIGDTHFSDNFFDLLPKTSKKIKLSKSLEKMEVMSLWDAMN